MNELIRAERLDVAMITTPEQGAAVVKEYQKAVSAARAVGTDRVLTNKYAENMVRSVRRTGELIAAIPREQGKRTDQELDNTDVMKFVQSANIVPMTAWRWESVARIPQEAFDELIEDIKAKDSGAPDGIITLSPFYRLASPSHGPKPPPPIFEGEYRTVVIDPPWEMMKIEREVRPNQVGFDYTMMSLDELAEMALPLAEASHLYVWTTQKYLPHTFDLLKTWGTDYLFTMVWHKPGGFQPVGLAQYNCEFVLVARRGGLAFSETKQFPTCFEAPRREHSRKPDQFYDIVRRVSPDPRADIFSRETREGFKSLGNEKNKFDGQIQ